MEKKYKLIGLAIVAIVGLWIWLCFPPSQVNNFDLNTNNMAEVQRANLENQYRATITQAFVGIAVLLGVYQAWQRINIAENTLEVSRQGQITERFTRAVEQLGSEKIEIRIGGIYALERISNESKEDYWQIMEILTNFIRINSYVENWKIKIEELKDPRGEHFESKCKVRFDIQAAINVIGRRKYFYQAGEFNQTGELKRLYLRQTYLRMISFADALPEGAHLEGAYLDFSDLIGAYFKGAHLEDAYLNNSCLNGAILTGADLKGAHLDRAYFRSADLSGADLSEADLWGADLKWANLSGADLSEADLLGANLKWANLSGADLKRAKNLTVNQLLSVKTLYRAHIDEELLNIISSKRHTLLEKPDSHAFPTIIGK